MITVLYVLMGMTLVSLIIGLIRFTQPNAREKSQSMMQWRLIAQAGALAVFAYIMMNQN